MAPGGIPPPLPPKPDGEAQLAPPTPAPSAKPDEVAPQAVRPKRLPVQKTPPSRRLRPGDLVCGDCGEGNVATRKFCSRCGSVLENAEVVKTPWWRRLIPKRKPKVLAAGERYGKKGVKARKGVPSMKGTLRKARRAMSIVLLLLTVVYGISEAFRRSVNERLTSARDTVEGWFSADYEPVNPSGAQANVEIPVDHPGNQAVDGFTNTFWAAPLTGAQPTLVLVFTEPVDLDRAIIRNGAAEEFTEFHRAKQLHLVFSNGKTDDIEVKDSPDPQEIDIDNGHGVTSVEIHVVGVHQSLKGSEVAISEIELFRKK